ncbi:unnamed protein product [Ectocarpus sp. CCAP 1310/34]|nr:unnamed protein product [Ectocarpus sp. CCAP 1310/34]
MLFVVHRLQELGRRKKIPLSMCFVDLKKAYDSVKREMPWKVLARAGIPAKLIKVIRQFHDGMRARVRMDDGELSDWFFVTQGVRQGCVLSPLLFNIFFAKVLEVVVIRLSEDDVVLRSLVCLAEGKTEARGGMETPLDRVRRAVWGMLCADDAGVVSRSAEGLAIMMTIIVEVFGEFGPTVSEKKTEALLMRAIYSRCLAGGWCPKYSEWFDVGQGLRQGCNLAPLLFNLFFAAMLMVAVTEFDKDPKVTADMVKIGT